MVFLVVELLRGLVGNVLAITLDYAQDRRLGQAGIRAPHLRPYLQERRVRVPPPQVEDPFREIAPDHPGMVGLRLVGTVRQGFLRPVEPLQPSVEGAPPDVVKAHDPPYGPSAFGSPLARVETRFHGQRRIIPLLFRGTVYNVVAGHLILLCYM